MDCEVSEESQLKIGTHQGSQLSTFPLAVMVDVASKLARECVLSELLYADDLVLVS